MSTYGKIKFVTLPKINGQYTIEAHCWNRSGRTTDHAAPDYIGQGNGDTVEAAKSAAMASAHAADRDEAYRISRGEK